MKRRRLTKKCFSPEPPRGRARPAPLAPGPPIPARSPRRPGPGLKGWQLHFEGPPSAPFSPLFRWGARKRNRQTSTIGFACQAAKEAEALQVVDLSLSKLWRKLHGKAPQLPNFCQHTRGNGIETHGKAECQQHKCTRIAPGAQKAAQKPNPKRLNPVASGLVAVAGLQP